MSKKPRSEKQLANDKRLGELAKARHAKKEDEFVPTEVIEKQAKKTPELVMPKVTNEVIDAPQMEIPPTPAPIYQLDPAQIMAINVAVQTALMQNPQLQHATPEEKLQTLGGAHLNQSGAVQGIVQKQSVKREDYPDPTERLLNEQRIQRFAPHDNFIFKWSVDGVQYVQNNVTFAEPKFTLELYRRLYDDDGELTGQAGLVSRNILHDDEFTTKIMAGRLGILDQFPDDEQGFRDLMNEIRYERIKAWMISLFVTPKIEQHRKKPSTMVIDGKAIEVLDTEVLTSGEAGAAKASQVAESVKL